MRFGDKKNLLFLLIILAIATFFRLWQLSSIPPGLYPDVAMNGNDAIETLRTGNLKVFYPDNNGREGMMMWLIALSFSIFGVSIWAIKIVAAIIGILTVLGLYLLTKELFSKYDENASRQIALLASFFLAISFWHVNFSRLGFRAILLPFVLVFGFYFLFRGFRQKKLLLFVTAGVFFGLGFYTYISYRFIVLLLPIMLIYWLLVYSKNIRSSPPFAALRLGYLKEKQMKKFLLFTASCLLFTFVIALPIGIYFIKNPQDFIGRATPISIFAAENPLIEFGKSLILHLGMFNIYGDSNWRHNYATSPELFWPMGILFLIGVIISIKKLVVSIQKKDLSLFTSYFLLLSWLFIFLLPGILTYEGIPHSLRTIGVIPPAFIFAGLGAWKIYEFLNKNIKAKKLLIFSCFFFLLALAASEFNKYFVLWANNDKVKEAYNQNYADIGYFLNSLPQDVKKYVIINTPGSPLYGISIAAQTPLFIEATKFGKPRATYLKFENLDQIDIYQNKSIVVPLYENGVFAELSKKFPWGEIKKEKDFQYYDLSY